MKLRKVPDLENPHTPLDTKSDRERMVDERLGERERGGDEWGTE
jgi:hypothetical protein